MKQFALISACLGFLLLGNGCQKKKLDDLNETIWVENQGAQMPAFVRGNGSSKVFILLLHGGPGGSGLEYRSGPWYEPLEEDYAMIYWDQRGQGTSTGNYSSDDLTVDLMVDDLRQLIRVIKHKYGQDIDLFLFGHSWGGTLGTAYMVTQDYQQEVSGWIEANGAHDIPFLNREAVKMFLTIGNDQIAKGNNVSEWQDMVDFAAEVDTNNISSSESGVLNSNAFKAEELLRDTLTPSQGGGGLLGEVFFSPSNFLTSGINGLITNSSLSDEIEELSYTDQLSTITVPTLLLWGRFDFVVPPALGESALQEIGSSDKELIILEGSGHSPMNREPDRFTGAIRDFIERNR